MIIKDIYNKWGVSHCIEGNGYEDIYNELNPMTKEEFLQLNDDGKASVVDHIFSIYRGRNIFPITYYNEESAISEIIKCVEKNVSVSDDNYLNIKFNQGSSLCKFLFPSLHKVQCKDTNNNSPYDKFYDDEKLKKAISFCLKYKKSSIICSPSCIKDGLDMIGGNVATNFRPMVAKAIYEKYTPKNGVIYDFACGFGGRMLGALSSKNNYKYMGVEPCTETFDSLNLLGTLIEKATNRKDVFKVYKVGSEDFSGWKESVDFAFSSPPYFNLEKYSDEGTQCYIKFSNINDWIEGYVRPTIKNIYNMLKHDRYYAVNIADFKIGNNNINYVDKWIDISIQEGFEFKEQLYMTLQARRGNGHDESNNRSKKEGIFVFYKK